MKEHLRSLKNTDIKKRFYYNYICNKVKCSKKGLFVPYFGSKVILGKTAIMNLDGVFAFNADSYIRNNGRTSILLMEEHAALTVKNKFTIGYGADIKIFKGGNVVLGKGYINVNVRLRCQTKIEIGDDVVIAHNVLITDTDGHNIVREDYEKSLPVQIGNHVWIGANAAILKGVTIGEGAVIAAGTVVNKDVPPYTLVAGNPMKLIREKIEWR